MTVRPQVRVRDHRVAVRAVQPFALVQYLQYKPVGKWSDYLRGERAYIILSLVAKSLLAWQIFANTLIPQPALLARYDLMGYSR